MTQTVFVTGASGFIAKHILVKLLNAGFDVVGSVRRLDRVDEICNAVRPHLNGPVDLSAKLRFVALDLAKDDGWAAALQGADVLMHTASPFPMSQPKDEDDIVRPAVDGALRALKAAQAAGIKRVVMTSSTVSIMSKDLAPGQTEFTEADWSDTNHPTINPYGKSKTLAERAAWDFITNHAPDMELTVINPGFVLGTPLDKHFGTSIKVIKRLLDATDPMLPQFGFSELLFLVIIALVILGPKDLSLAMRKLGQFVARGRSMANEFRAAFDDIARQAELDDLRKEIEDLKRDNAVTQAVDELKGVEKDINESVMREERAMQAELKKPAPTEETPPPSEDNPSETTPEDKAAS